MIIMEIFSERLRSARIESGMTQQQLADLLYLDRTTIVGNELRDREPSFQIVVGIANALDVSTDYLFGRIDVKKMSEIDDKNYLSLLSEEL